MPSPKNMRKASDAPEPECLEIDWNFIEKRNPELRSFVINNFRDLYYEHLKTPHLFDQFNVFKNPGLFYTIEVYLIALITDFTAHGYTQQAEALHQFLASAKQTIESSSSTQEQGLALNSLGNSLLKGLHLDDEQDSKLVAFATSMLSQTLKHPVLSEDYDVNIYLLYAQLNEQCAKTNLAILTNTHLASSDEQALFKEQLDRHYFDILSEFFPTTGYMVTQHPVNPNADIREQAVLNFFVNAVARLCQFERASQGQDIHNAIYLLGKMYDADKDSASRNHLYTKVLRQILQIPSKEAQVDSMFDEVVVKFILGGEPNRHFKIPFDLSQYVLSITQTRQFSQSIQTRLHQAEYELRQLKITHQSLEDRLLHCEAELAQLKFNQLTLENEESTSPELSPSASRKFLKKFKREKRSLEEPPAMPKLVSLATRTFSDSEIVKKPHRRKMTS